MTTVIFCLPCVVCLAWAIIFKLRRCNPQQKLLMHVLLFAAFYFMNFALFVAENTNYVWASRCDIVNVFVMPTLMAMLIIYVHSLNSGKLMSKVNRIMLLVPGIVQTAIIYVLYMIVGIDNAAQIFCHEDGYVRHGLVTITQLENSVFFKNDFEKIFYIFDEFVVTFLVFVFAVILTILSWSMSLKKGYRIGDCIRFWFFKKPSTPPRAITFSLLGVMLSLSPMILLGTSFVAKSQILAIFMSLSISGWIFLLSYIQFFDNLSTFTLHDLTHVDMFAINAQSSSAALDNNDRVEDKVESVVEVKEEVGELKEEKETGLPITQSMVDMPVSAKNEIIIPSECVEKAEPIANVNIERKNAPTSNIDAIMERLNRVMDVDLAYKDQSLTRDSLAEMISSNRTTLSAVLNYSFGMNFKTYIATKRIEKAKELLCANPEESLDEVAFQCGFKDASAFCHKFKDIVGETPKVWAAHK